MDGVWQKCMIYGTVVGLGALLTLFTFDTWETVLIVTLLMTMISYLFLYSVDKLTPYQVTTVSEGFVSEPRSHDAAAESKYEWLGNDDLFDDFYASVFTKLTQNENLIQAEAAICMEEFLKHVPEKSQMKVLDAACGIGIASCAFAKLGAGHVVGIDKSQPMIRYAKGTTLPGTTLTPTQKQDVEFRTADLIGPGAASAAEFNCACLLYFSVYYFQDLETLLRNMSLWVQPGGCLAIEVVNKYKFDPVLDSSNPWVGVSPQRYMKDRLTKSKAVFDQFEYDGHFELMDPKAEFRETFRFKDGSMRRQKHRLYMPSMEEITKRAQTCGWRYTKYVDLMPLSFSYGYLLFFERSA